MIKYFLVVPKLRSTFFWSNEYSNAANKTGFRSQLAGVIQQIRLSTQPTEVFFFNQLRYKVVLVQYIWTSVVIGQAIFEDENRLSSM